MRIPPTEFVVVGILTLDRDHTAIGELCLKKKIPRCCIVAGLILNRTTKGENILAAVVGSIQVVAVFRIQEVVLESSSRQNLGSSGCGRTVKRTDRHLRFSEVTPVGHAIGPTYCRRGIPILNAVDKRTPFMRVVGSVQVCAIAWWQKTSGPDIEAILQLESSDGIHHADCVGHSVVLGIERELDHWRHGSVQVDAGAVEQESVRGASRRPAHRYAQNWIAFRHQRKPAVAAFGPVPMRHKPEVPPVAREHIV